MKLLKFALTFILLIILIYLRVSTRNLNPLWVDEIEEINHLKSVTYLISEYLPNIPGALPGHYLLALSMNYISPGNKFVLGLPGLFANIAVFFLIPYALSLLRVVDKKNLSFVTLVTRLGLVFDPRLTYQAMEVRPYSILPLLWIASVILISNLFQLKKKSESTLNYITRFILLTIFTVVIFIWHFYGFIMVLSIYSFMLSKQKGNLRKKFFQSPSTYPIILSTIISIPIWRYFTSGLANYRHNTFGFLSIFSNTSLTPSIINKFRTDVSILSFILILCLIYIIRKYIIGFFTELVNDRFIKKDLFGIIFYMVFVPVIIIFFLDLMQPYYFLYRQFSWVAIPFYIAVGILINSLFIKKSILKK